MFKDGAGASITRFITLYSNKESKSVGKTNCQQLLALAQGSSIATPFAFSRGNGQVCGTINKLIEEIVTMTNAFVMMNEAKLGKNQSSIATCDEFV